MLGKVNFYKYMIRFYPNLVYTRPVFDVKHFINLHDEIVLLFFTIFFYYFYLTNIPVYYIGIFGNSSEPHEYFMYVFI